MARIIKFRGLSMADDSWVYGDLVQLKDKKTAIWPIDSESNLGIVEVYPNSVGQYTNLKDRNKKEIYEGDIVRQEWVTTITTDDMSFTGTGIQTGLVVIRTKGVCISPCLCENHVDGESSIVRDKQLAGYRCEIIGNKHDDPKLLETILNQE